MTPERCTAEQREFAEEHIEDFINFALAGDPNILENFALEHSWYDHK